MKNILNNAVFVDVRTPEEFAQGHYPGAMNIPLGEVSQRIHEFKQIQQPIVTYCRSGNRSGMAASILQQNGITDVYNGGGLEDLLQQKK
ncbi:phage shock protein E [Hydrobacter penzbergensis]|jgi:phage shock protein E|uniref:Phage shock protein E n=1 Tax=Hydrobacter penzbergensis TaxID=1235997 RepID=A0A8X8LCS4_9BACT|nr:rhodanese-like domain-containing protein [Hydrobacter penzbergensis]MBN8717994.1 rhodanese-like domain-containing protein [Sediminibacterium magnilacihabitans]PQV61589.1 rhodanese-like domain-containing protein [Sediminibacterium magnilacihabitans]SDW15793.1 phage shock protein E [Hydrobacter penzbergensis]